MERRENRIMATRDGRRLPPRNSRGEFRRRRSRRDRGMDYEGQDMRGSGSQYSMRRYRDMGDYNYDMRSGDYAQSQGPNMDMRGDYRGGNMGDMARNEYAYDGHYGMHGGRQGGYQPVEFMGYCSGYYGSPEQDYGYNMRCRSRGRVRDYGYDYGDYDDDYGDYGQTLSEKELEHWCKRLKSKLSEQEKQMFSKEAIMQKAKAMGKQMEGFGEKELEVVALMLLDDYKKSLGVNPDLMIKLAFDWLNDEDAELKGAEKLAVYYDEIVMGGEEE